MKNNIFYPIATTAILAVIGFLLDVFGFDFKGLASCYNTFLYYKEIMFVAVSFVIIISVIIYDCFKNKFDKDKQQLKDIKDKNRQQLEDIKNEKKELSDEVNYLKNEINNLKGQLKESNENLTISKQKLNEMIEIDKDLRAQRALKNLRGENK